MAYRVFISSISQDQDLAHDIARRIKEVGVKILLVPHTVSGTLSNPFRRALFRADEVVLVLTPSALKNQTLIAEMGAAFGMHKRVTPIVVGIVEDEIPPLIKQMRYVRYSELPELISAIKERAQAVPA